MSRDELERVVSRTCFDYHKVDEGEIVARQGERCGQLMLLIDGTLELSATSEGHIYEVTEWVHAPAILEQAAVFGLNQRFAHTMKSTTQANLITLDKTELLKLTTASFVFRLNIFNSLATALQKQQQGLWATCPASLTDRVINFFFDHVTLRYGHKVFHIKMTDLADQLNDRRLNVSHVLNDLRDKQLLTFSRGRIDIPKLEALRLTPQ